MKRFYKVSASLWMAMAACILTQAQQSSSSLGSLWERTVVRYPGIQAKELAIEGAAIHQRMVKSQALPQARLQAQNSYGTFNGSNGAFFPQPGFFNVSGNATSYTGANYSPNSFGSATVEWELFAFGKQQKENETASINHRKTIADKDAYLLELKKELSLRYINLLYHSAKQHWTTLNTTRLNEIRQIAGTLSVAGLKPAADSLLANASWLQALAEESNAKGNKQAASFSLMELSGSDSAEQLFSTTRFLQPYGYESIPAPVTNTGSHPILVSLNEKKLYQQVLGEVQSRSALPSLKLLAGYAFRGTGIAGDGHVSGNWKDGFRNSTHNMLAGIGITWNITSVHQGKLKREEANKEAERLSALITEYEGTIQTNLLASRAQISEQRKQLIHTNEAIKDAVNAYDMYLARYKSGLISLNELLQIRKLLEEAEVNHIEAARRYWMQHVNEATYTSNFGYLFNNL